MGAHSTGKYIKAQFSDTWGEERTEEVPSMVQMPSYEPRERASLEHLGLCVSALTRQG